MTVPPVPVSPVSAVSAGAVIAAPDAPAPVPVLLPPPAPLANFAASEFRARRDNLRKLYPDGMIVLRGATDDEPVKPATYSQNNAFFYLTGVDTPGAFLVLLPPDLRASAAFRNSPGEVSELLFLPARNPNAELWMGPRLGPGDETEKLTGIEKVMDAGGFWPALTAWLRRNPVVYTVAPYGEHAHLSREFALMQHILHAAPVAQIRDLSPGMADLRVVKSPAEIERVTQAIAVTIEGHKAAHALITNGAGRREYEVEAAIFAAFRNRGAHLAFASIVGAGRNATVLHYEDNHHIMQNGELVVVDIGAEVDHYCGDITRTYAVGGAMSPRQQEIYGLVKAAFDYTVTEYKPGVDSLKSIDDKCKAFLDASPLRARNADGSEQTGQTMKAFMPHGLGHHLGLDVHDVIANADKEAPLVPGSVITVEPGVYIAAESIGVRLEHDFLVTPTGLQWLGPQWDM